MCIIISMEGDRANGMAGKGQEREVKRNRVVMKETNVLKDRKGKAYS